MSDIINMDVLTTRIRNKMEELCINQSGLAKLAGITPSALSQILSKERTPSTNVLIKIAGALGESVDFLVGRTEETSLDALLQNSDAQLLFREFSGLSQNDKDQVLTMIEVLKQRKLREQ